MARLGLTFLLPVVLSAQAIVSTYSQPRALHIVNVLDFGCVGDGQTNNGSCVLSAISAAPEGATIYFPNNSSSATYVIGCLGTITKGLRFDFGGSTVKPLCENQDWLILDGGGGTVIPKRFWLVNFYFTNYDASPVQTLIKLVGQNIDTRIQNGKFYGVYAESLLWNYSGWGATLENVEFQWNVVSVANIRTTHISNDVYTNFLILDKVDMTNTQGACMYLRGGRIQINNTIIQSCQDGGILAEIDLFLHLRIRGTYFEGNEVANIKLAGDADILLEGSEFQFNPSDTLLEVGDGTVHLTLIGNTSHAGCVKTTAGTVSPTFTLSSLGNVITPGGTSCDDKLAIASTLTSEAGVRVFNATTSQIYVQNVPISSNSKTSTVVQNPGTKTFLTLPGSTVNGDIVYCSDCNKATPCASGGPGALAKRINGSWDCN